MTDIIAIQLSLELKIDVNSSEKLKCGICKQLLLLNEFHSNISRKNGKSSVCKTCYSAYKKEYRLKRKKVRIELRLPPATKSCSKCKRELALSEFHRDKRSPIGVESQCKKCSAKLKQQRYQRRKQHLFEAIVDKQCTKCLQIFPIKNFKKHPLGSDGYASWCNSCKNLDSSDYKKRNLGLVCAWTRKRQAAKLQATPPWVKDDELKLFYLEAERLTRKTGVLYTVDHIIPLIHPLVCGLHVPANLQVITGKENFSKQNTFIPFVESEV